MEKNKTLPAKTAQILRKRVKDLFKQRSCYKSSPSNPDQYLLEISDAEKQLLCSPLHSTDITEFINFCSDVITDGDIYLFGGIIRDLALFGPRAFNSDIDIVVDGDLTSLVPTLENHGAIKNKFGGYRLYIENWPIDIWQASETWAIKSGFVNYEGISSLINTTVLNWDAILMNWRTENFIFGEKYFQELQSRSLKIILAKNPNPLGMLVRILRHMCLKEAEKIDMESVKYLSAAVKKYNHTQISTYEMESYGSQEINRKILDLLISVDTESNEEEIDKILFCDGESIIDSLIGQASLLKSPPNIH